MVCAVRVGYVIYNVCIYCIYTMYAHTVYCSCTVQATSTLCDTVCAYLGFHLCKVKGTSECRKGADESRNVSRAIKVS